MPKAETKNPPAHRHAATAPDFRGPSRSTHVPNKAADEPRKTIASVNVHPSVVTFQSPGADCVTPRARVRGSQNTLKPYAIPIDRCVASAAGGTSHRLNPGGATMRSRERKDVIGTEGDARDDPDATPCQGGLLPGLSRFFSPG